MTTATMTQDTPIFRSGHEAIRYAYNYNAQQYPITLMGRMMRGMGIGSGRGLYGLDGAAIAGSVKRFVEALPHDYRYAIVCRYAATEDEFLHAVHEMLGAASASIGTGITPTRAILSLIGRYYGRPVKLASLCSQYDMDAATMTRRWQRIRERMRALESHGMQAADDALVIAGLVE